MERSVLAELERAELASHERRLAAEAEAERRLDAARAEADRLREGIPGAVETALGTLRRRYADQADAEIAAIEAELAALSGAAAVDDAAIEPAVDLVVAAVLGEREV